MKWGVYNIKGEIARFKYSREAIACLPAIARAVGTTVWMLAPPRVALMDIPRGCRIDKAIHPATPADDSLALTVEKMSIVCPLR